VDDVLNDLIIIICFVRCCDWISPTIIKMLENFLFVDIQGRSSIIFMFIASSYISLATHLYTSNKCYALVLFPWR
jgi:hypothetical protein